MSGCSSDTELRPLERDDIKECIIADDDDDNDDDDARVDANETDDDDEGNVDGCDNEIKDCICFIAAEPKSCDDGNTAATPTPIIHG